MDKQDNRYRKGKTTMGMSDGNEKGEDGGEMREDEMWVARRGEIRDTRVANGVRVKGRGILNDDDDDNDLKSIWKNAMTR